MIYIFPIIASIIHIYIFSMESLTWGSEKTNKTFGMNKEAAEANRLFAFNQGFYNLFLAIAVIMGLVFVSQSDDNYYRGVGIGLVFSGLCSMLGAAIVLFLSAKRLLRAALIQGVPPLFGILILLYFLAPVYNATSPVSN